MIKRVLYVDDDVDDIEVFLDVIKIVHSSIEILAASDGREALKIIQEFCPDYIFLDYKMPGMNGMELFKEIKKTECNNVSKIIMYSDSSDVNYISECRKLGAFDCWAKLVPGELSDRLRQLFSEESDSLVK